LANKIFIALEFIIKDIGSVFIPSLMKKQLYYGGSFNFFILDTWCAVMSFMSENLEHAHLVF
jgi:hypothetical protein